ncbi:hypothetical protein PCASD_06978 [Puccinia coronata f. sp. avenae]|uniref:Uncharacterized protein n=1 Tax=Puccinia coronata f. sp. avenae TaxID=200324 RepID=A0A2N5V526_9BASI|nr:hypothetical protein PCASD_06978 [Puccinia coronata f. sp. avenae]
MPFPLFTNPFNKSAHPAPAVRSPQPPDPVLGSSYSYNQTKPITIIHQPNSSSLSSATPPHSGILKQVVSLSSSTPHNSCDSAAGPPPPPAARDRTQSLATTHSRASPHIRSPPASPDSSFKLESAHLIKKLKSYGSNPDKAALTAHKVQPRPPPLRLSNQQRKPRHAHTHHASTAAGHQPSPLSPRSRSASAAATVFDIVRPSRRRDGIGMNTSSILVPLTPPLPTAPLFSGRSPIERIRRDGSTTQQLLSPSPLPLYTQSSSSRPHAHRRASSLDSINTRFPTPHSKHPHYFQAGSGFHQPYAKASPNSSGLSHSECSEDFVAPSSCTSTAHTTPISCAHFRTPRSRLSSRDFRHLTPHGLKPHLTHPHPHVSLSPKSMLPSQLARPLEMDPLELPASSAPATACWTLNISASSSHASTTTCLIPDLPGTILRLQQQTPTDSSKCMLEPYLHKVLRVGTDGNMLVEWEVRLAAPPATRSRYNSTISTVDMPRQKSTTTRTRTTSKSRFPAMKTMPGSADAPRSRQLSLGPPMPSGPQSPGKKKAPHAATSLIMLNLGTFRAGDMADRAPATAPLALAPRFPSMGSSSSLGKSARSKASLQPSHTGLSSSSPASSMSCSSSSSLSPAEGKEEAQETEDYHDGEREDGKPPVRRRGRFDTYVPPPINITPTRPPKSASRPSSTPHARSPGSAESQPRYNAPMMQLEDAHPKGTRPAPDEKDAALSLHHHHHHHHYHHYGPDGGSGALVDSSQRLPAGPHRPSPRSRARGAAAAADGSKTREKGEEEEFVDRIDDDDDDDDDDEGYDMKEASKDVRVGSRRRYHRRRNSLDSAASLRLEKSYWSETDTTTTTNSSVLNFMVAPDSDIQ